MTKQKWKVLRCYRVLFLGGEYIASGFNRGSVRFHFVESANEHLAVPFGQGFKDIRVRCIGKCDRATCEDKPCLKGDLNDQGGW